MYDDRKIYCVNLGNHDFSSAETMNFRLPPGYQGKLIDIGVMTTQVFACDATAAIVELGTSADPNAYASLTIPDATADNDCFDTTDDTDAIIADDIAAGAVLRVTITAGTDGSSESGEGHPFFVFEIFK